VLRESFRIWALGGSCPDEDPANSIEKEVGLLAFRSPGRSWLFKPSLFSLIRLVRELRLVKLEIQLFFKAYQRRTLTNGRHLREDSARLQVTHIPSFWHVRICRGGGTSPRRLTVQVDCFWIGEDNGFGCFD
jgi:hypothetical protein